MTALDVRPHVKLVLAPMAHDSKVWVIPGKDDWWFEPVEISHHVTDVAVRAKVGDATRVGLSMILADVEAEGMVERLLIRRLAKARFYRISRWWQRHGFRLRPKLPVATYGDRSENRLLSWWYATVNAP